MKNIGAIFYTDFHCDPKIMRVCQEQIKRGFTGEIVSVSLNAPLDFGRNLVHKDPLGRSYPTMVKQILMGLEALTTKYVFYLEHDVCYSPTHFDYVPPTDDVFYYNVNSWRWLYPQDYLITYNELTSLSGMCCSRELALKHYRMRWQRIDEFELYEIRSREPKWARKLGYEPGTKPRRRGGITDEDHVKWKSALPNIDIRHGKTFSAPKVLQEHFKKAPTDWRCAGMDEIPGWDLKGMFNLK